MNSEMQLAKLIFSSETTILPVCVPNKTFGLGEGQITIKISGELHPPGAEAEKGSEVPLLDSCVVVEDCTIALCVAVEPGE